MGRLHANTPELTIGKQIGCNHSLARGLIGHHASTL
jgi:hypothetical protein